MVGGQASGGTAVASSLKRTTGGAPASLRCSVLGAPGRSAALTVDGAPAASFEDPRDESPCPCPLC